MNALAEKSGRNPYKKGAYLDGRGGLIGCNKKRTNRITRGFIFG